MPVVVFFSHNGETLLDGRHQQVSFGNTEVVAKLISQKVNAEVSQLVPVLPYPIDYQATLTRSKAELEKHQFPEFEPLKVDFRKEDEIFIGFPVWWGTLPMIVQHFLMATDLNSKIIYPFCTHEGSGFGRSKQELQRLLPATAQLQTGLAVRGSRVTCAQCAVNNWLGQR
ncbi:flavodoxin [Pediococcus siamensis]|uniref:flavodoxin n=1 Tax=Pediococcus siamensis TaxID=381829 RepID=UPI0039A2A8CD